MKVGTLVKNKENGWIGRITRVYDELWYTAEEPFKKFYDVKWFDVKKKYSKYRIYQEDSLTLLEPPTDNALGDWLSTPQEKLRNALAIKTERTQLANTRKPRRLDGR